MKGYFHSVETFGTVDGPGIRYVLFLSGCNLKCKFCHNADTWETGTQTITVSEVLADIKRYKNYYEKSGGGLTVSGGEPLLQADFVEALFKACRAENIHTLIDTAGFCPPSALEKVLPYTDQIQFSLKAVDADRHKRLTGVANDRILANLRLAAVAKIPLVIRYVVIPGITDTPNDIEKLAALLLNLPTKAQVELLAYHTMGVKKWKALGKPYELSGVPPAAPKCVEAVKEHLTKYNITVINND